MTDPIADLLTRIRNAAGRRHETVTIPASKLKAELLRVLKDEGFITDFERGSEHGHPVLQVHLRYVAEGEPIIAGLRRVSKPGRRVYVGRKDIKPVMGGMGLSVLSTSKGLMTDHECRRAGLGGEVLCEVW